MHKQECLDDSPLANRLPIRNVFRGVYDKQLAASRLAIDRPCINENWASCTVQKAKEGRETGQNGSDRDREEVGGRRNIDLQQPPHPFTPIPFTAFLSRNIVSPWRLFFIVSATLLSLATRHSPFFSSPQPWVFLKGARNFAYETAKREKVRGGGTSSDIGSFNYFELARSIDTMKYGSPRITNYDTLISYWSAIDAECW